MKLLGTFLILIFPLYLFGDDVEELAKVEGKIKDERKAIAGIAETEVKFGSDPGGIAVRCGLEDSRVEWEKELKRDLEIKKGLLEKILVRTGYNLHASREEIAELSLRSSEKRVGNSLRGTLTPPDTNDACTFEVANGTPCSLEVFWKAEGEQEVPVEFSDEHTGRERTLLPSHPITQQQSGFFATKGKGTIRIVFLELDDVDPEKEPTFRKIKEETREVDPSKINWIRFESPLGVLPQ